MTPKLPAAVTRARLQLMLQHPYLASACARFPLIVSAPEQGVDTMATDGYRIFLNPAFTESLSERELLGVLAHELLHNVLEHLERRQHRAPLLWNIAIDHATNLMLQDLGFELPEPKLSYSIFRGQPAEAIYQLLEIGFIPDPAQASGFDRHLDVLSEGAAVPTALERHRLKQGLRQELKRELQNPSGIRQQGLIYGAWEEELGKADTSRTPWQAVLARFVSGLNRNDYRSFPFNKKHLWRGIGLPSFGVPGPQHLVLALDTSGSMSRLLLQQLLAEVDRIRALSACRLTLVECDAAIQHITDWEPWDDLEHALNAWRFRGRGGTSFAPVFNWVSDQIHQGQMQPDAVLYLTDGYADFPPPPAFPLLWAVPEEARPPAEFPYGEVLLLPHPPPP